MTAQRRQLPAFIADVLADRAALATLGAACLAIAAAGLDPHILDPNSVRSKAALAASPESSWFLTATAIIQASLILIGGAVADIWRSVRLLRVALAGLVVTSIGAALVPHGWGLLGFRFLAWACDGMIIPFAVGVVAQLYSGEARGTAIGILLAAFGAATFISPILPTIFGPTGPEAQAFAACAVVALLAIWASRRAMPDLPGALRSQRLTIVSTAIWAIGIVIAADGAIQSEWSLVILGAVFVVVALALRRIMGAPPEVGVKARAGGAALTAGLVIGFSQAIPMTAMPLFFSRIQGVDGLLASVLLAPFVIGVLIAGPSAGWLLARFSPRLLIFTGVWAIALSDLVFVLLLKHDTGYLAFVLPFSLLGAGFMVSTAVRTAVIFASTPRRLAGTAAALNEASLGVGTRLGVTLVVLLQGGGIATGPDPLRWLQVALVAGVVIGGIGGVVVMLLIGSGDPVRTMWDHRDEREASASPGSPTA